MKPNLQRPSAAGRGPARSGFTLIELLAAMTVLAIILMLLGQVFSGSTLAWETGTRRMDQNIGARAVMDLISRDLSEAVSLNLDSGGTSPYGSGNSSSLSFTALIGTGTNGECRTVTYAVASTTINGAACYQLTRTLDSGGGPVADNVAAFVAYANGTDTSLNSQSNQLPCYVDIFLSMLSTADAQKADKAGANKTAFVEKHEKRYTTRVFLNNQKGYSVAY